MIESATRKVLLANPDIVAVVQDRVWYTTRPQGERRPGAVITRVDGADVGNLDGPAGVITGTLKVDVLAPTYAEAKELAWMIATLLNTITDKTFDDTTVDWLTVSDESDIPALPPEGKALPQTYGISLTTEFMCH